MAGPRSVIVTATLLKHNSGDLRSDMVYICRDFSIILIFTKSWSEFLAFQNFQNCNAEFHILFHR